MIELLLDTQRNNKSQPLALGIQNTDQILVRLISSKILLAGQDDSLGIVASVLEECVKMTGNFLAFETSVGIDANFK